MLQRQGQVDGRSGITADPTVDWPRPLPGRQLGATSARRKAPGCCGCRVRLVSRPGSASWVVGIVGHGSVVAFGFEGEFESEHLTERVR